ncbi:fatty acid oxidation complex subunit alpha FadJ [Shewanella sp. 202IG2-18]|uniref:fatty acid oxidation complex subunit alpha FadJ n=1 Tax=Parashewanella hymeniacidonis TaxID=2807618 RepID=UPI001960A1B7|nr:fatty acid oxidation complex subunit alpha FadJ [Parashewanella hymeniacidonis]MBM7073102.1 fatty acid oxidation complex subunit alpha FadJ [Parashewanella hymeniacidonis]
MEKTFNLSRRDDGIAVLTMDVPGESVNTLQAKFAEEITDLLKEIKADRNIKGMVVISGKKNSFIAGADIKMLDACATAEDARTLSKQGHEVFAELESLPFPIVAAIHGNCLGGGLELAMACHMRICSDSPKTMLGLPEVMLGLLPGGGGTQRLPRLVGIATALDMMLTGKQLRPKQALKNGLVHDVVPNSILLDAAIELAKGGKKKPAKRKTPLVNKILESNSFGRNIMFDQAAKQVNKKTQGNYPAPPKIIDCVKVGMSKGMVAGLDVEARHFADLVMTKESAALRSIFFATTEMKKEAGEADAKKVNKAVVLGGGLMGGGIASVTTTKAGIPARVKDINENGLSNALSYAYKLLDKKVKRRHMKSSERDATMALMTTTTEYKGVKDADIVVEAVFEDLNLKHQMVKDIERECSEDTIFASNTSSLPIGQIAEAAERPENVIGLHYFSPVEKMPLVEVIAHKKTSQQTIDTTVAFARKQGKTPIVVQDGAGFYVNRILALYMNEAASVLLEGQRIEHLDKSLVKFGFPVGPMTLLDEVGIDVGAKISPILEKELGERFEAPKAFDKLLNDGRKGRKSEKGFYLYGKTAKKGKKQVDESVYKLFSLNPTANKDPKMVAERCVVQMLNEAARCLEDGIIASPRDGDIGAIFGIGFPPFLGGPFKYMDQLGVTNLVDMLKGYQSQFGDRFAPCDLLLKMTEEKKSFY